MPRMSADTGLAGRCVISAAHSGLWGVGAAGARGAVLLRNGTGLAMVSLNIFSSFSIYSPSRWSLFQSFLLLCLMFVFPAQS